MQHYVLQLEKWWFEGIRNTGEKSRTGVLGLDAWVYTFCRKERLCYLPRSLGEWQAEILDILCVQEKSEFDLSIPWPVSFGSLRIVVADVLVQFPYDKAGPWVPCKLPFYVLISSAFPNLKLHLEFPETERCSGDQKPSSKPLARMRK